MIISERWLRSSERWQDFARLSRRVRLAIMLTIALFVASCKSSKQTSELRSNVQYRDVVKIDSVVVRDTIKYYTAGDTVFVEKARWRWLSKIDTVVVRDTVERVKTQVIKETERVANWSGWLLAAVFAALVFIVIKQRLRSN